jgi:hypothetical protein
VSRLTLRLPETLHQQLAKVAEEEGVSLNQYIVYALTRQTSLNFNVQELNLSIASAHSDEIEHQETSFKSLKNRLGEASLSDVLGILADREVVNCEPELTTNTIDRLREKIRAVKY